MNTLPKEMEDIIYEYTHQLNMNKVLDDLCQSFSRCDYCRVDKHDAHLSFCKCCSIEFCNDCKSNLEDKNQEYCDSCFYEQMNYLQFEGILERKLSGNELTNVMDFFEELEEGDKREVFHYINFLRGRGFKSFTHLFTVVRDYVMEHL